MKQITIILQQYSIPRKEINEEILRYNNGIQEGGFAELINGKK